MAGVRSPLCQSWCIAPQSIRVTGAEHSCHFFPLNLQRFSLHSFREHLTAGCSSDVDSSRSLTNNWKKCNPQRLVRTSGSNRRTRSIGAGVSVTARTQRGGSSRSRGTAGRRRGSAGSPSRAGDPFWNVIAPPEEQELSSWSGGNGGSVPFRAGEGKFLRDPGVGRQKIFVYYVDGGGEIVVRVHQVEQKYVVLLEAEPGAIPCVADQPLLLHWGLFRSDQSSWVLLEPNEVPPDTTFLDGSDEAMRTPWRTHSDGQLSLKLEFRADMAPFAINFVLFQPPGSEGQEGSWFRSSKDSNFCVPVGLGKGKPEPLGVSWLKDGSVNFALYSRAAEAVSLCLYEGDDPDPTMEIDLESSLHRTGDTWHVSLDDIGSFNRYGYRCKGETSWEGGSRFHSRHVLLDPYATIIATPVPGQEDLPSPAAALGLLTRDELPFDWEGDYPPSIPMEETVAYRMSVPGFTLRESSQVAEVFRGTFVGVVEKIDHLVSLGVNAVILQPIAAYDELQGAYFPLSFFAPMATYGPGKDGLSASSALKFMVKELHKRGIEVILEVVYSHTAEQDDEEPKTITFRGIDNSTYYITDPFGQQVVSTFGAPNVFNCNQPVAQQMILDSLKHWVETYHVDGFLFPNAAALVTGPHGQQLSRPLLVEAISFDPVLAAAKLIADPTSPITGECQEMAFPHWGRWQELNRRFRDDIRRFTRGEPSQLSGLATRLCGSGDMFARGRGPCHSLNYVAGPHGLTLADLVTYTNDRESSWGCGEEGPSVDPMVTECRKRQVRNFVVRLFLSQGVPVLTMGDECGYSKGGATEMDYGLFPWEALEEPFAQQLQRLLWSLAMFRNRRRALFQRREFLEAGRLAWHGVFPDQPLWDNPESNFLAVSIRAGEAEGAEAEGEEKGGAVSAPPLLPRDVYLAMNAHHYPTTMYIPSPPHGHSWYRVVDTNLTSPDDFSLEGIQIPAAEGSVPYDMQAYSCLVLEARAAASAAGEPMSKQEPPQPTPVLGPESFAVRPRL